MRIERLLSHITYSNSVVKSGVFRGCQQAMASMIKSEKIKIILFLILCMESASFITIVDKNVAHNVEKCFSRSLRSLD